MVAPLTHGNREFAENVPESDKRFGAEQGRLVSRTHQGEAHFVVFAAGRYRQILEIVDFLAAGEFQTRKTHAAVRIQFVCCERLEHPSLQGRLEAISVKTAGFEQVQSIGNERIRLGRNLDPLAETLPEGGFCRSHKGGFTETPAEAHFV